MMNKVLSDYATIIRRGVKTPLGYWSAGAAKNLEQDIYQVEKAGSIPLDSLPGEKIAPLLEPTMPIDAKAFVEIMAGEEQRGGLTHVALGELGFRLSGFAINQLVSSIQTIIEPFVSAVEKGIEMSLVCLHEQYTNSSWEPLKVRGRDSRNKAFGYPTEVTIAAEDVDGKWRPEVKLLPVLPKDDAQRAQLAHMARADGTMSLDTIQDVVIGLDDPALEQEKMAREWANNQPINRLYDAYIAFVADGQMMKAQNILMELKRVMGTAPPGAGAGLPPPGQAPMNPTDLSAMGAPGAGLPPQEGAVSPELMPNEMLGGMPPGSANAGGA